MFGEPAALQSPRQPLPEKHILLVEDEATSREILTYFLRGKGYVVDAVGSAGAAITCLESVRYALVISDWLLPDGNGVDVADAAVKRGAKTLIVSGLLFRLPGGAAMRHELLLKHLGPTQVLDLDTADLGSPRVIVLVGTQAATRDVGRALAERTGIPFSDPYIEVEAAAGETIEEIVRNRGQSVFDDGLRRVIQRLLDQPAHVLALPFNVYMNASIRETVSQRGVSVGLLRRRRQGRRPRRPAAPPLLEDIRNVVNFAVRRPYGEESTETADRILHVLSKSKWAHILPELPRGTSEEMSDEEMPERPEPGPGSKFVETARGFEIVSSTPGEHERDDPTQKALHARLIVRFDRLTGSLDRISNTHPTLVTEFRDYGTFLARELAELDVPSLWSSGNGLSEFVRALDAQEAERTLTPPLEPEPLAELRALVREFRTVSTAFIAMATEPADNDFFR